MAILERQLRKMLVFKSLLVASLLVSSLAQEITEQESEQKSVVKSTENSEEIKRQGPQQAGWGGLISGKFFYKYHRWSIFFVNYLENLLLNRT